MLLNGARVVRAMTSEQKERLNDRGGDVSPNLGLTHAPNTDNDDMILGRIGADDDADQERVERDSMKSNKVFSSSDISENMFEFVPPVPAEKPK